MSVAVDGLTDYTKRMQSNTNASYTHPLVNRFSQANQNAFKTAPTPGNVGTTYSDNNNLLGPAPTPGDATNPDGSNPNNPQSLEALPNMPTQQELAGAGNPGGGSTTPSQSDSISRSANASPQMPQAPNSLLNPAQPTTDPIAQAGHNELLYAQATARNQAFNQAQNNIGTNPNASVAGFNPGQLSNAQQIINLGIQRGMSRADIQTALMTSLAESGLNNINGGDRDSLGLFQQRPSQGWGSPQQILDPTYSIGKFYDALSSNANRASMTPWQAAQAVQRSAFADGSNYQAQFGKAQQLMASLYDAKQNSGAMIAPTVGANGSAKWISSNYNKYLDYDGYYGAQCVDLYAFYTSGFVGGNPYPVTTADQIWNHYDANAYVRVDRSQGPQMGDVGVWGKAGSTPYSHVGIIIQDNGDGTVKTLSNNATSSGPNGNSAIVNISKSSLMGYLRPRKLLV